MKTLVLCVVVIVAALIGGKVWRHQRACTPTFDENYTYVPGPGPVGRVFLFPGMEGSATRFLAARTSKQWVSGLAGHHFDVVIFNTPIPKPCWFSDGGYRYRAAFLKEFDDVAKDAAAKHGHPPRTIVSGVSYGGMHAMVVFSAHPHDFIGWQAAMPVTRLGSLEELTAAGDAPGFNAFTLVPKLRGTRGFVSWGDRDTRVDHRLIEDLAAKIGVTGRRYPGAGHTTTPQAVDDLVADARSQLATQVQPR